VAKLLQSKDEQFLALLAEALRLRRDNNSTSELLRLLKAETEYGAARLLGEIAPLEVATQMEQRVKEIDARLEKIAPGPSFVITGIAGKPGRNSRGQKNGKQNPPPPPAKTTPESFEVIRLSEARGALVEAISKIRFRDRYAKARDDRERHVIYTEARNNSSLSDWADIVLHASAVPAISAEAAIDAAKFSDAPTTGETLFPQETSLYLLAPNLEQTLERLDAALSGVQMETVRDQMTFAFLHQMLKARLASTFGADSTGSVSAALGIDLKAPVGMAQWSGERNTTHSAVLLRVNDRDRLERMLGLYQKQLSGFGSFVTVSSALARFAGAVPAAIPVIMVAAFSPEASLPTGSLKRRIAASLCYRQARLGNLPITVIEKLATTSQHVIEQERIYLAYLGTTAVLAPSRAALSDLLGQAATRATLAQSDAYHKARSEAGEMVFFSQPGKLYRDVIPQNSESLSAFIESISSRLGAESGALRLTPTGAPKTWETIFRLNLQNSEGLKNFSGFGAADLSAPRMLLPHTTVLYAGAVFDPKELLATLKAFDTAVKAEAEKKSPEEKRREAQFDEELEQRLVPALHGETAFALLSLKEIFSADEENRIPAMAFALRLKDQKVAEMFRAGKLFTSAKSVENATALGAPVATLDAISENIFFTVTDDYLVLADSVESLRRLEAKEKFAATRDYIRSTEKLPNNLALFVTYSLDAAFDEARRLAKNDEDTLHAVSVFSALIHAFHSQRAFVAVNTGGAPPVLEGSLAVSFDREGRYNVGRVGPRDNEFDVANALIAPKGLNLLHPTRLESLRLRVTAKQSGLIARVREDISRFAWQKAESSDELAMVWSSTARRIPDKLTIKLPVTAPEFEPYLKSTARINTAAPQIVALANQIAGDDKDGRSVARKLGEWTHTNLKWKKVESSTVETLASREADCLEHSELYVALARSLGLPARVVTGAAYSSGSFGAHAWVEIYLGQWVEVDPTWGLLDYVDATHLRFADDSFISYAMLNQVALEILETRSTIAEFQKDPARLVREFAADSSEPHRALAFDLALTAEQALGADVFAKLNDKQRAGVINAFDRATAELIEEWAFDWADDPSILASEIKDTRARLLTVFGDGLLRFHLAARDGAWYVTEIENVDEATQLIGDALRDALSTDFSPTRIRRMQYTQNARALEQLEKLIAAKGESPSLLLLRAGLLRAKQLRQAPNEVRDSSGGDQKQEKPESEKPDEVAALLRQITTRWPGYAPAWYKLAGHYPVWQEQGEKAVEPFQRYAQLMPLDPRPWERLGALYDKLNRLAEAENAYLEAVKRDPQDYDRRVTLAALYLKMESPEKARASLAEALKLESDGDSVFSSIGLEIGLPTEEDSAAAQGQRLEKLLLSFPQEIARSKNGLYWLAQAQQWQKKYDAAIRTMQRSLALKPTASDHAQIAYLHRAARRYTQALTAANQALKPDQESADAHFERACVLARLGRKKEAIASLKRAIELNEGITYGLAGEEDLKPLAALPEFRALLPKEEPEEKQETKSDKPAPPKQ
jgi:Flp pilus assembly protein TadD